MGYGVIYVASTATEIVPANTKRKVLWLTNTSTNSSVALGPDSSMTSTNAGAVLFSYQTWEERKNFGDYKGPVYGATIDQTGAKVFYWEVEGNL